VTRVLANTLGPGPWARLVIGVCSGMLAAAWCTSSPYAEQIAGAAERSGCNRATFSMVLDVGHSIEASGATSARGATEYDFNLRLAKRIEQSLGAADFANVHLMVSRGRGRSGLLQRSAEAAKVGANLFLSIHHDSVQDFYLQKWTYQGKVREFSDRFRGYSIFVSYENARPKASLVAATFLGDELQARGLQFTRHHAEDIKGERRQLIDDGRGIYRFDDLVVLKNTKAPAILFEAGVIVNREEEALLASTGYQDTISSAVVRAVERFCDANQTAIRVEDGGFSKSLPPR
jgi:N-acetylmuramoyl-L-alanine amidase